MPNSNHQLFPLYLTLASKVQIGSICEIEPIFLIKKDRWDEMSPVNAAGWRQASIDQEPTKMRRL